MQIIPKYAPPTKPKLKAWKIILVLTAYNPLPVVVVLCLGLFLGMATTAPSTEYKIAPTLYKELAPTVDLEPLVIENQAAPVVPKDPDAKAYIAQYSNLAVLTMKKYGVPASISLAQGLIESRAGTSKLAISNNNHFGMKCFSRRCKKGHCSNFTDDTHKDFFKKFASAKDSWLAHGELVTSGRYAKLKHKKDFKAWAYGLKQQGYATDKGYAQKLIRVIQRYNLQKFDR